MGRTLVFYHQWSMVTKGEFLHRSTCRVEEKLVARMCLRGANDAGRNDQPPKQMVVAQVVKLS